MVLVATGGSEVTIRKNLQKRVESEKEKRSSLKPQKIPRGETSARTWDWERPFTADAAERSSCKIRIEKIHCV